MPYIVKLCYLPLLSDNSYYFTQPFQVSKVLVEGGFTANNISFKNDEIMVISPLDDSINAKFIKCEIGAMSYVLALIGLEFGFDGEFWSDLDEGELSGESNIGEEELPQICEFIKKCDICIISDEIFETNKSSSQAILSLLKSKFGFKIVNLNGDEIELNGQLTELKTIPNYDNAVIFTHPHCNEFRAGSYLGIAAKLKNGEEITINSSQKDIKATLKIDPNIKGTIGFLGFDGAKYGFEVLKFSR